MKNKIKKLLNAEYENYNNTPLDEQADDPIKVARMNNDPLFALLVALFSYGSAKQIVKFTSGIKNKDYTIHGAKKYRFQTEEDVKNILKVFKMLRKEEVDLEKVALDGNESQDAIKSIQNIQRLFYERMEIETAGLVFYFGKRITSTEVNKNSALKRYNMFLRWMVRDDNIDIGIFKRYEKKNLIIPVDVHVGRIAVSLGLTNRTKNDFRMAKEITEELKKIDPLDPVKYDFAIYRIGQRGS